MSHGDACAAAPPGFTVTAATAGAPVAAFEDAAGSLYGVQFHPEVLHTEHGQQCCSTSCTRRGQRADLDQRNIIDEQVERIRAQVGDGRAICGLSGGVDSAVAAALVQRAIGDQLTCVFVDHGLLRQGEAEQVERDFVAATGVKLGRRRRRRLPGRAGRGHRPGGEAQDHRPRVHPGLRAGRARDRRERARTASRRSWSRARSTRTSWSPAAAPATANIKSHHNVGGLPEDLQFELVEPLRTLFKDEVRAVGARARAAGRDRLAPAVPRPGPGHPDRRRGHRRAAGILLRAPTRSPARS